MEQVIDILLFCPNCGEQHIDEAQPEKNWFNPPHRSHECQFCFHVWRPSDVATNGVRAIQTKGKADKNPRPRYYATAQDYVDSFNRAPGQRLIDIAREMQGRFKSQKKRHGTSLTGFTDDEADSIFK